MLHEGLYEQVIDKKLDEELQEISTDRKSIEKIDEAESPKVLSRFVAAIIEKKLSLLHEKKKGMHSQVEFVNQIIDLIGSDEKDEFLTDRKITENAEQLLAIINEETEIKNKILGRKKTFPRPESPISSSSLFTGAVGEPQIFQEFKKEIESSDRIDMLVSFIKWSGLRLLIDELRQFTEEGKTIRIITTSYMGATDIKAIEELERLKGTTVKISYDTKRTRLHAKTYVFHRETGFSTAYIGSSNLSNAAITSGLEWNMKITMQDMRDTMEKINATFESYWNSPEFEEYTREDHNKLEYALKEEKVHKSEKKDQLLLDIMPFTYQQEILDSLDAERNLHGRMKNLVVAATGTGKTFIAGFDYRRFRRKNGNKAKLLFVAHRKEILEQSRMAFRMILRDMNFGDIFVGGKQPSEIDNLFISIQTFNSRSFCSTLPRNYYDFIIVDEFHHAAATSYQELLSYFKPKILLGLTATPERADGKDITRYFDGHIAAEIRLPEAIDRNLLCPFQYFGVTDTVDLDKVGWTNGHYDVNALAELYLGKKSIQRAENIISAIERYVTDLDDVKGLGFCVTITHAAYMSDFFNSHGIPSIYLTGSTENEDRSDAKRKLVEGEIKFIFVVDIYNEGVDIPEVNTVLFLRPTESLTVFLQQLGRGLRLCEGKDCLTVLDFIGNADKRYDFRSKFASILEKQGRNIADEAKNGFPSVPRGCSIILEEKAMEHVLLNIENAIARKNKIINEIAEFNSFGKKLTLENFLAYSALNPKILYDIGNMPFSQMKAVACKEKYSLEPIGNYALAALKKLSVMNSRRLIAFILKIIPEIESLDFKTFSSMDKRLFQMFYVTVFKKAIEDWKGEDFNENMGVLESSPKFLQEIEELLSFNYSRIDFVDMPIDLGFDCPLDLHCSYTRDQILVALDFLKPDTVREGVKWLPEKKIDVLLITLNKAEKDYSPSTMYNDYSINDVLFHWQSQSTTSANSPTGMRYKEAGHGETKVLLFVRKEKRDPDTKKANAELYTYLGPARCKSSSGSSPMNIIWSLEHPIPARFVRTTNRLAAV